MKKVIFDTDIGIDDAMALLFLYHASDVEVIAITTGFGNASVSDTTRNALYMKELFGMSADVYAGSTKPLGKALGEGYADFVHGKNGLGDIPLTAPMCKAETMPAAEAIAKLVRENPHEISIVAVGRMTNLAMALALEPKLPSLVKELVVMGGVFGYNGHRGNVSPVAEANIAGDPLAADRVFTSGIPTAIVGLDVTAETVMNPAYIGLLRQAAGASGEFIHQISRFYLGFYEKVTGKAECPIHDASAVAYLLRPDLYRTEAAVVRVATEGIAIGQTIHDSTRRVFATNDWVDFPTCDICIGVNAPAVLELYLSTLSE